MRSEVVDPVPGSHGRLLGSSRGHRRGVLGRLVRHGDLVRVDRDGYVRFAGRRKQIIIHDGSNIARQEVEDALLEHPAVTRAGVVGVHDLQHGENVWAYVALRSDVDPPSASQLIDFAADRVGYKAPDVVEVLDEIPVNVVGKTDRGFSSAWPPPATAPTSSADPDDRGSSVSMTANGDRERCWSAPGIGPQRRHRVLRSWTHEHHRPGARRRTRHPPRSAQGVLSD